MGEWKTAWDHIVFEGFLGVRMKLQFTWEGCDSALAAPLLLDLIRLRRSRSSAARRGPLAEPRVLLQGPGRARSEHQLHRQYEMLERWVLQKVAA